MVITVAKLTTDIGSSPIRLVVKGQTVTNNFNYIRYIVSGEQTFKSYAPCMFLYDMTYGSPLCYI